MTKIEVELLAYKSIYNRLQEAHSRDLHTDNIYKYPVFYGVAHVLLSKDSLEIEIEKAFHQNKNNKKEI